MNQHNLPAREKNGKSNTVAAFRENLEASKSSTRYFHVPLPMDERSVACMALASLLESAKENQSCAATYILCDEFKELRSADET